MKLHQVAAQMYTLREFTKTPDAIAESIKKVADIGYQAIQVSAFGPIDPLELRQICADNGVAIIATHEPSEEIRNDPEKVVDTLKSLGCKYTAYPYPKDVDFEDPASVNSLIADLENATQALAAHGQVLTYHNHACEFLHLDGEPVLEKIYRECSIQGEIDTYWVQAGGANPEAWCRKLKGRLPLIHLKDFKMTGFKDFTFGEIGSGNIDFRAVVAAAEESGCQWFIVEQDVCPGDPFDSLKMSFDYIKGNLTED